MRRRLVLGLWAASSVALAACGSDGDLSASEQDWAEQATLQVARVNDVFALDFLPAMLGQDELAPVVEVGGAPTPDWEALDAACVDLEGLVPDVRGVGRDAPAGLAEAGANLTAYADTLESIAAGCRAAAEVEDLEQLRGVQQQIEDAGVFAEAVGADLPNNVGCPEDVPEDRPETCDA